MIYTDILDGLRSENRLRSIPNDMHGLDLVSNDYMGLGRRCGDFTEEFTRRFPDAQMSASASRLLQRSQKYHRALESMLDDLYGKRALLFNSGYHANVGALSALSVPGALLVSDKLSHASMIDGIRLGYGDAARFAHNDMDMLRRILEKKHSQYRQTVIATESVFSMDGDLAPLEEMVRLKHEFPGTLLYVDEAHAFGVFGNNGLGLCERLGLLEEVDILIGTFGKAAAGSGAFVATSQELHDYLLNASRSFIFSTALPPATVAWDTLMVEKLVDMRSERSHLKELSRWFGREVALLTGHPSLSGSQIVPVHAGSAERAIAMADSLRCAGIDALPIRRPTVPAGGERIRLSLSAGLEMSDLIRVLDALRDSLQV